MKFSDLACQSSERLDLVARVGRLAVFALLVLLPVGCGEDRPGDAFQTDSALDLGDDWDRSSAGRSALDAAAPARTTWAVLLKTFTHPEHATAAARMIESCRAIDPALASARVETTDKGSIVVYGSYDAPNDTRAKADLEWIKSITYKGAPVFARAMLTPIEPQGRIGSSPYDLARVRSQYPNVRPLYTLSVAVWGDFESGSMSWERIVSETQRYCRTLRSQGHDAWVYFDPTRMLGEVTVGVFGPNAIDPQSQIVSPEVEAVQRQFPHRLVNGETLQELINPRVRELGTRMQSTRLVEIP